MALKVGITGGIGSGKTTVCRIFESIGIPVYYSDERAKFLMIHDVELVAAIKAQFGTEAYLPDGQLNRTYLADIVFKNASQRQVLNALVHPAVQRDGDEWHAQQNQAPYTLKESALLFEIGIQKHFQKIITVYSPKSLRLERLLQRDKQTIEALEARMAAQMPDEEKRLLADYVILNDNQHLLIPQVQALHQVLVALSLG